MTVCPPNFMKADTCIPGYRACGIHYFVADII
jgi:hypothetical protein